MMRCYSFNIFKETLIKSEIRLRRISGGGIYGASPRDPESDFAQNQI